MAAKLKWSPDGPQSTFVGPSSPAVVLHWLRERSAIERGEAAGDEVIRLGRFCCVRRQDDRSTRWLHEHWLQPHHDDPDLWFIALLYRACINDGRVAGELTLPLPWNAERLAHLSTIACASCPVSRASTLARLSLIANFSRP
jgi:hypothetical protein